jgi:hypothetical protein
MEARHAPILAVIPPPAQYAMTFFAGAGLDRLTVAAGLVDDGGSSLDRGVACLRWIHPRGGLGAAVRAPAHDAQSGRAAVASYREGRARLVAQSDVSVAHDHLCGYSARARQILAIGLRGPAVGRHELDRDSLRGIAPSKSLWPRLR